jgi:streptomycin 6-kinase
MFTPEVIVQLVGGVTVVGYLHVQLREVSRNLLSLTQKVAGLYSQEQTDKMIDLKIAPVKENLANVKADVAVLKGVLRCDEKHSM